MVSGRTQLVVAEAQNQESVWFFETMNREPEAPQLSDNNIEGLKVLLNCDAVQRLKVLSLINE